MKCTRAIRFAVLGLAVAALASGARADWDLGDAFKMHYPQLPDLEHGYDVVAGAVQVPEGSYEFRALADDWRCTRTGPVTGIHIWSSYNNDVRGTVLPNVMFNLSIYSDVPAAQSPTGYSMPGERLWGAYLAPTAERVYAPATEEFYDPMQQAIIGQDSVCWQYNFEIDAATAFVQQEGTIYWLSVGHTADFDGDGLVFINDMLFLAANPGWAYGWKTTTEPFNDAAVWADADWGGPYPWDFAPPSGVMWNRLALPTGYPLDLAFVITPEPATLALLGMGVAGLLVRRRR